MRRYTGLSRYLIASTVLVLAGACAGSDLVLPESGGPAADVLLVSGDDQSASRGEELPEPLVVRVVDQAGNPVSDQAVSWVVGVGDGSVAPASAVTDSLGLASARLTLGPSPGPQTVSAVVPGLPAVTFTASATGTPEGGDDDDDDGFPHHLVFLVQPSDAIEGERLTPPLVVAVVDRDGDVVPEFEIKIELELAGGSGELDGKREEKTRVGVATFDDLKVEEPGEGKVLRAFAPEEAFLGVAESEPFTVRDE